MDRTQALRAIKEYHYNLANIPEAEWAFMENNLIKFKVFDEGEYFCRQGEKTNAVAYLAQGLFESNYIDSEDSKSIIQKFYDSDSSMASYSSILNNSPSDVSITALEKSYTFIMTFQDIQSLYSRHECWQIIGRRFGEIEYVAKNKRAKELLTKSPEDRYQIFIQHNPSVSQRISDRKIAQYLGINYVSLSRIKKRISERS